MMITLCMVLEIWNATDRIFYHFGHFLALLPTPNPPNNLENQKFQKMKTIPIDIIILDMCTMKIL